MRRASVVGNLSEMPGSLFSKQSSIAVLSIDKYLDCKASRDRVESESSCRVASRAVTSRVLLGAIGIGIGIKARKQ